MKRSIWLGISIIVLSFQLFVGSGIAAELDTTIRTVPLKATGETTVLSLQQIRQGKKLFSTACAQCHVSGVTKTDPNIGLGLEELVLANPRRDNIEALVDYMQHPTTHDGATSLAEVHPNTQNTDIFPRMRNLADGDLEAIAGYILLQPRIVGERWGGGKVYY